jgi:hypothetical protein
MTPLANEIAPRSGGQDSMAHAAVLLRATRRAAWIEGLAIAALTAAVTAVAIGKDLRRPFDCDELFTYYSSKASDFSELFGLLSTGGFDASPPLYVVAVWQAQRVIGDDHLALRLPATLGLAVMSVCLYGIARRSCPAPYAALVLLTPQMTSAFAHATSARSYGLMLGFTGMALFCWRSADRGRWRPLALVGLGASLAAGVATHYYAILILAPLVLAEITRTMESGRKRLDIAVWVAFAFGLLPLPVLHPLIAHARDLAADASWLKVSHAELQKTYLTDITMLLPVIELGSILLGSFLLLRRSPAPTRPDLELDPATTPCMKCEIALVLGLITLPILAFSLGVTVTHAYSSRYVVAFVAGIALLIAYIGNSVFRGRPLFATLLATIMLTFLYKQSLMNDIDWSWREDIARYASQAAAKGHRLIILNGDDYIVYHYYLEPSTWENITLVDQINDRHAKIYEGLNRWLVRKRLGAFDQRNRDWLMQNLEKCYLYGSFNTVVTDQIQPHRRLAIELLDEIRPGSSNRIYRIEADGVE